MKLPPATSQHQKSTSKENFSSKQSVANWKSWKAESLIRFDLATKAGGAAASVIEAIQEQQGAITDEKNALRLTRGFSDVVRRAVGQETLSDIQLQTLERNMALTEQCFGTLKDVESFLGGLRANCIVIRKHVQEEADYHNDALWSDRSTESLIKRFDDRYLLIINELQA